MIRLVSASGIVSRWQYWCCEEKGMSSSGSLVRRGLLFLCMTEVQGGEGKFARNKNLTNHTTNLLLFNN